MSTKVNKGYMRRGIKMANGKPVIIDNSNEPIQPGNADGVHSHGVSERTGWHCPVCNVGVHPDSKVCPNCVNRASNQLTVDDKPRMIIEQIDGGEVTTKPASPFVRV